MSYISFLHQTTTITPAFIAPSLLSYISFLHQTTTWWLFCYFCIVLSYISFLHQTTTRNNLRKNDLHCLISLFYIKPQPWTYLMTYKLIVLYLFSTSNHNKPDTKLVDAYIVLYLFSTSNHNLFGLFDTFFLLSYISFLHQTTTFI